MGKIPRGLSGQQVRRALEKAGFEVTRQRGSHIVMNKFEPRRRVVVADHREVRVGTLQQILVDAGLTVEEFQELV